MRDIFPASSRKPSMSQKDEINPGGGDAEVDSTAAAKNQLAVENEELKDQLE